MIELRILGPVDLGPDPQGELAAVLAQPKRLALLAYLATAAPSATTAGTPHFVRRDTLSALFWPDRDQEHARSSLRQALRGLRQAFGPNAILTQGYEAVALDPAVVRCDAAVFDAHAAVGAHDAAVALYRGDFLTGFFLTDAPEFERWMEDRRARLRRTACAAARALSQAYSAAGKVSDATEIARRAANWCSDDEGVVRSLIALLDRAGDHAGAMQSYDAFARRLKEDYDCDPADETLALVAAIRTRVTEHPTETPSAQTNDRPTVKEKEHPRPSAPDATEAQNTAEPPVPNASPAQAGGRGLTSLALPPWLRRARPAAAIALVLVAAGLAARAIRSNPRSVSASITNRRQDDAATLAHRSMLTVTIRVPEARALFEAGVERLYANQPEAALRLFLDALSRDSSCAMCAYYASRAGGDGTESLRLLDVAARLSSRVSPRERWLIHYTVADEGNDTTRLAIAESLLAAYPDAPESEVSLGEALMMAGEAARAIPHFERTIALDSAALRGYAGSPLCWACDAEHWLMDALFALDSTAAAVRAGRAWTLEQPNSADAWRMLASALANGASYDDARTALDSAARYESRLEDLTNRAIIEMEANRYDSADALLAPIASTGRAATRREAVWWEVISLRAQGRRREALSLAQGPLRWLEASDSLIPLVVAPDAEAQVLFEMGRYREAAQIFRTLVDRQYDAKRVRPGAVARAHAWWLAHVADALASAGDTSSLAALADTVEWWGHRSGFARDHWLHYYLRALLWIARSRPDSALAMLQRAPPAFGRENLALAKCDLAVGNPIAAIRALQPAMRLGMEAGNYYVTRTELHEALAQSFDAAGEADSAAAHYRAVVSAWARADPELLPRVKRAQARLNSLRRQANKS